MSDKLDDVMSKLKDSNFIEVMKDKYKKATPKEKKQHDEIKEKLSLYFKNKDYKGAGDYLKHVRSQIT